MSDRQKGRLGLGAERAFADAHHATQLPNSPNSTNKKNCSQLVPAGNIPECSPRFALPIFLWGPHLSVPSRGGRFSVLRLYCTCMWACTPVLLWNAASWPPTYVPVRGKKIACGVLLQFREESKRQECLGLRATAHVGGISSLA